MRKSISFVTALILTVFSQQAFAQSNPVVVELYTSQGCSSCPPADKILTKLALRDDVIPLALHVDYWDYIGWKDTFGDPRFTTRQRGYARAAGSRTIYTPQMIIGGITHVVGNKPMDVVDGINAQTNQAAKVSLELALNGKSLSISANSITQKNQPMVVQLVRYIPSSTVAIKRGENAGRSIEYTNVVTEWRLLKKWDGSKALSLSVDLEGENPVVVIVQTAGDGPILAAARLR